MKRVFADLHLKPDMSDLENAVQVIKKASELGYRLISVPVGKGISGDQLARIEGISREFGLDFATRMDLKPKTPGELLRLLRKFRRSFEVLAVICDSKAVARQAAKDRRVDLLNFPPDPRRRFFDKAEAELASQSLASLEIDIEPLLRLEGPARIRLLAALRKEASTALSFHVPIVISSGACEALYLRKPLDTAALTMLFDMDKAMALDALSRVPLEIVRRNRAKLSPGFIAPGIRLIRKGKDCP
ncbi:MAG: RNase P subunit p30 family protein [Candidatus Bathyarchaeia archaeon]